MRLLPKGFVIHKWGMQANKLTMTPIHVEENGRIMHLARPETVKAFNQMTADAKTHGVRLKIIWAYRSTSLQADQFNEAARTYGKRGAILRLAPPGYSEHQTGWALDIGDEADPKADDNSLFERTQAFKWLVRYARKHGFEMSFPPKNWQGVNYEPWHWRYVGTKDAQDTFHPKGISAVGVWSLSVFEAVKLWIYP